MCFHTASAHKMFWWRGKLSRFSENVIFFRNKDKHLIKLRENGTIRDFPHDCGTADTYVLDMLT